MAQGTQEPAVGRFAAPETFLSGLPAEAAQSLLTAASDIVLLLSSSGQVLDLAGSADDLVALARSAWVGRPWIDTVTDEGRPKIEALLQAEGGSSSWRQVTHPDPAGAGIPIAYCTVSLPAAAPAHHTVFAFGRDLRPQAALQQRVVNAQLSMERDYWRLRDVETRYRLLLQSVGEAVLILDAATERLEEANTAAFELLGDGIRRPGWTLPDALVAADQAPLRVQLAGLRANGRFEPFAVRLEGRDAPVTVWAASFRQDNANRLLVRLIARSGSNEIPTTHPRRLLPAVIDSAPDGVVVTDPDGRILGANRAFLDLAQLASEDLARGHSLDQWLGRSGVDLNVLISNLRQRGSVRLFATRVRGNYGSTTDVEISAVSVPQADHPCLGFVVRDVGRRLSGTDPRGAKEIPRSVGQMKELVGRMPLKDIVRETTDLIEQLCIEAALELTGDNRASAAEMLGLSRQSLYVKLRRFGIGAESDSPTN